MSEPRIRVVSDIHGLNTVVYIDGKPIDTYSVRLDMRPGHVTRATIEFEEVAAEIGGPWSESEQITAAVHAASEKRRSRQAAEGAA